MGLDRSRNQPRLDSDWARGSRKGVVANQEPVVGGSLLIFTAENKMIFFFSSINLDFLEKMYAFFKT